MSNQCLLKAHSVFVSQFAGNHVALHCLSEIGQVVEHDWIVAMNVVCEWRPIVHDSGPTKLRLHLHRSMNEPTVGVAVPALAFDVCPEPAPELLGEFVFSSGVSAPPKISQQPNEPDHHNQEKYC